MVRTTKARIRSHGIICATALGLVLGFTAHGGAATYTYTKLVDTSGNFLLFGSASINDVGTVAFSAALDTDGDGIADASGIFLSDGTTTTTVADSSGSFNLFGSPSFQDGSTVAFWATLDAGGNGVFTSDGTTTTTIADTSGPFSSFSSPSKKNGAVAFWASFDAGGNGVFTSDGTTTTTIADTSGPFSSLGSPSINSGGAVTFLGTLDVGESGVFVGNGGGPSTTVVDSSGPYNFFSFPSGNDLGTVVFWASLDAGGVGIFKSDGTTVADTSGSFSNFSNPAINDAGTVAFQGFLPGITGVYTGPDTIADKVIAVGDPLSGSSVTWIVFSREGLNDMGQVAFIASLADGTQAIYRADPEDAGDPVPPEPAPEPDSAPPPDAEPSTLEVSIDITPGGDPNSINLGSKGTLPVAILSSATFDARSVDPTTVELAGAYVKPKRNGTWMASYEDVNGDGLLDLVVHVEKQALELNDDSTVAVLTGYTYGSPETRMMISGSQSVRIVP